MIIKTNGQTKVVFENNMPKGITIIQGDTGFHIIEGDRHRFVTNEEAMILYQNDVRDRVREIFGAL